ncbi:MAG TPA: 4'-phosphopantetheinyl transferase superfamily protein [Solirubrobacterales bacterium]|nr:4'-phosphopantetheinyl transferase superfamily protein [Solirubrobacterales bacterium]
MRPPLIGIDLLEPERLRERLMRTPTLREELFLPGELAYADAQHDPHQHLAARLSAKEAVIKALGIAGWDPLDIEVIGGGEDSRLLLHGGVEEQAAALGVEVTISMSHLNSMVAAVAMARPITNADQA